MTALPCPRPLLGFYAASGTGKTTLLTALIPLLGARGLRVAVVKHTHHRFDLDQPGKDSYRLRSAGADQVLLASRERMALLREFRDGRPEPRLAELVACLDLATVDLVLVEGFKHEPFAKIELHRPALGRPLLHPDDPHVIALATDGPVTLARPLPVLDLNQPEQIARFIGDWMARGGGSTDH